MGGLLEAILYQLLWTLAGSNHGNVLETMDRVKSTSIT